MKMKFSDIGRCLICCCNPCQCKKETDDRSKILIHSGNTSADSGGDLRRRGVMEKLCIGCVANNGNCGLLMKGTIAECPRIQRLQREANAEKERI
jgi:hypothetical protein